MKLINIYKQLLKETEYNQKFDYIGNFNEFGLAKVVLNRKCNLINKEGKLISDIWFDQVYFEDFGRIIVNLKSKGWNFLNKQGDLLFDQWFKKIVLDRSSREYKEFGLILVINYSIDYNHQNYINKDGTLFSKKWYETFGYINKFNIIKCYSGGYINFLNLNGEEIFKENFIRVEDFNEHGIAKAIIKKNTEIFINAKGENLFKKIYDKYQSIKAITENKVIVVDFNNNYKLIIKK